MRQCALSWKASAGVAVFWLSLSVVTLSCEISSESDQAVGPQRNFTLAIILLCSAALWLATSVSIRGHESGTLRLALPDVGGSLIIAGGFALFCQITVRLLASSQFSGRASAFDFGLKCTVGEANDCNERNVAFKPEFNSFGHCVQGCFSFSLFPARFWLSRRFQRGLEGASCILVFDPAYNVIKRCVKHGTEFSASSFANNGAEWSMGFLLGLSTWLLCSALLQLWTPTNLSQHEFDKDLDTNATRLVLFLRALTGFVLCAVALVSAVLFGMSWNNTIKSQNDDEADIAVLAGFIVITLMFSLGAMLLHFCQQRTVPSAGSHDPVESTQANGEDHA